MMTQQELIERGESLASELVQYARIQGLSADELMQVQIIAQRLLSNVCYPGDETSARNAVLTGHAVFDAISQPLEPN